MFVGWRGFFGLQWKGFTCLKTGIWEVWTAHNVVFYIEDRNGLRVHWVLILRPTPILRHLEPRPGLLISRAGLVVASAAGDAEGLVDVELVAKGVDSHWNTD